MVMALLQDEGAGAFSSLDVANHTVGASSSPGNETTCAKGGFHRSLRPGEDWDLGEVRIGFQSTTAWVTQNVLL